MQLSKLEEDVLGDLAEDAYELWEIFTFVRCHHPGLQKAEVIHRGRELIEAWMDRGWLQASRSRDDDEKLSRSEVFAIFDSLGPQVVDPLRATILLNLTDRAAHDVEWIRQPTASRS
jgi:hypothetical protein